MIPATYRDINIRSVGWVLKAILTYHWGLASLSSSIKPFTTSSSLSISSIPTYKWNLDHVPKKTKNLRPNTYYAIGSGYVIVLDSARESHFEHVLQGPISRDQHATSFDKTRQFDSRLRDVDTWISLRFAHAKYIGHYLWREVASAINVNGLIWAESCVRNLLCVYDFKWHLRHRS